MNRTKLLTIAVLGLLLINLATLTFIVLRRPHPPIKPFEESIGPRGEGPKKLIIERLNFDSTQQMEYGKIVDAHRRKSRELNDEARNLHEKLYVLLKENAINKTKADSIIVLISENQKLKDNLNLEHFEQIKLICKPEQRDKFNALVDDLTLLFSPHGPAPDNKP
jgi:Spy/CpxP family protein refolding chaperone